MRCRAPRFIPFPDSGANMGEIITTFNGVSYPGTIASGSPGILFLDSTTTNIPTCTVQGSTWYCPTRLRTASRQPTRGRTEIRAWSISASRVPTRCSFRQLGIQHAWRAGADARLLRFWIVHSSLAKCVHGNRKHEHTRRAGAVLRVLNGVPLFCRVRQTSGFRSAGSFYFTAIFTNLPFTTSTLTFLARHRGLIFSSARAQLRAPRSSVASAETTMRLRNLPLTWTAISISSSFASAGSYFGHGARSRSGSRPASPTIRAQDTARRAPASAPGRAAHRPPGHAEPPVSPRCTLSS